MTTHYRVQHWPDMPGDGEKGDAIIFNSHWPPGDWIRIKSWWEAWHFLCGNVEPGDTIEVLPPADGQRSDDYAGPA